MLPTEGQIREYILTNPGKTSKEIAQHFGCSGKDINRPRDRYPGVYNMTGINTVDYRHYINHKPQKITIKNKSLQIDPEYLPSESENENENENDSENDMESDSDLEEACQHAELLLSNQRIIKLYRKLRQEQKLVQELANTNSVNQQELDKVSRELATVTLELDCHKVDVKTLNNQWLMYFLLAITMVATNFGFHLIMS